MAKISVHDVEYSDIRPTKNDRFPRIVVIIIMTEFCERFSYSGMRAFLTLYLRSKLGYTDDEATETYHIFVTFVYVFPIIGGIMADNYLGKFRTILYMIFVYACGNMLVAVTAIPQVGLPGRLCMLIGLFLITVGTGGIKPCVTAFGGDQFKLPEQDHHLALYFSIMYFVLCVGSLIAKAVSPILRSEVQCFGEKDCYSLAFGAPGLIIVISVVIFVSARKQYIMKEPEGNVVIDFVKCVSLGIKNSIFNRCQNEKESHWLDTTYPKFNKRFIKDVKRTLSILTLFTVLPVFWALLDQMGSRWTLQATKMDGRLGFVTIKPDQMQVLCPIFILMLIPVTQKYIYPFLERRNILKNPLHKLTLGGVLAGVSFIASGVLEIYLTTTYPTLPTPQFSQLRIFNGNPCSISIQNDIHNITYTMPSYSYFVKKDVKIQGIQNITLNLGGSCIEPKAEQFLMEENAAVSFFLKGDEVERYMDHVDKSKSGFPFVRALVLLSNEAASILRTLPTSSGHDMNSSVVDRKGLLWMSCRFLISSEANNISFFNEKMGDIESYLNTTGVTIQLEVFTSIYSLRINDDIIMDGIDIENGGVYTIMIWKTGDRYKSKVFVITQPNSITIALLLPQFFIISAAEVLFAVTGNEFAFKESPESMKAVMGSVWLLTEAFGNVIIIVITKLFTGYSQETQFFIYTGLMFVSIAFFQYLSRSYQFVHEDQVRKCRSNSEQMYLQVKNVEDCLEH